MESSSALPSAGAEQYVRIIRMETIRNAVQMHLPVGTGNTRTCRQHLASISSSHSLAIFHLEICWKQMQLLTLPKKNAQAAMLGQAGLNRSLEKSQCSQGLSLQGAGRFATANAFPLPKTRPFFPSLEPLTGAMAGLILPCQT